MTYTLVIRPAAQADIAEAHAWYEAEQPGLGAEFRSAVELALTRIAERPKAYPRVRGSFHRALVKRFPYGIFFTVTTETVFVFACFHGSRDPRTLRLEQR